MLPGVPVPDRAASAPTDRARGRPGVHLEWSVAPAQHRRGIEHHEKRSKQAALLLVCGRIAMSDNNLLYPPNGGLFAVRSVFDPVNQSVELGIDLCEPCLVFGG